MTRVLVIDDDRVLCGAVNDYLLFKGFEVHACLNATQALKRLAEGDYDLIVTDWELPDMAGIELCKAYRANGGLAGVIMLTGKTAVADKKVGFAAGVDDYLTKPFAFEELEMRVDALLRRANATKQAAQSAAKESRPRDFLGEQYEFIGEAGAGAMGVIYKARHRTLDRLVAIKTLKTHSATGENELARFKKEARTLSALDHPHIARVYDFGFTFDDVPFLAMEFIEGRSLEILVKEKGPLPLADALPIFIPIADAMGYVNDKGLIHRDIKPANVMLAVSDAGAIVPKLVDFGIVKSLVPKGVDAQRLTAEGDVFGSPLYMSPEQSMGMPLDGRSDIYSFGCLMFELLTGAPPFVGADIQETLLMRIKDDVPLVSNRRPGIDMNVDLVVRKALAREAKDRYQTFYELRDALKVMQAMTKR